MQRKSTYLLILFSCLFLFVGNAQDIHFTQYNFSPLVVNPAQTGGFSGTFRINGIYRDQYRPIVQNAFSTPSFSIDAPIVRGFGKNDWIGIGLMMYSDIRGGAKFTNNSMKASLGYHIGFGKSRRSVLSLGFQTGVVQYFLNGTEDDITWESELNGAGLGEGGLTGKKTFTDYAGSLLFRTKMNDRTNVFAGFTGRYLLRTQFGLINTGSSSLPKRYTFVAGGEYLLNKKMIIGGSLIGEFFGISKTAILNGSVDLLLDQSKNLWLVVGTGYRYRDGVNLRAGVKYKNMEAGIAYDIPVSKLLTATSIGSIELGITYIGKIYKRPKTDPVIFCPRF